MGTDCIVQAHRDGWMSDEAIGALAVDLRVALRVFPSHERAPWSGWCVGRIVGRDAMLEGIPKLVVDETTTVDLDIPERVWRPKYRRGCFVTIAAACEFMRRRGWSVYVGGDDDFEGFAWEAVRDEWTETWAKTPNEYPPDVTA